MGDMRQAMQDMQAAKIATQIHRAKFQLEMARFQSNQNTMYARQVGANDLAASPKSLSGEFMINAAGEAKSGFIDFPVDFLEKPLVSFGFEMKEGEVLIPGQMATAEGKVLAWRTRERPPISRFYTGFQVGAVTTGPSFQKMICVWTVTGLAVPKPLESLYG